MLSSCMVTFAQPNNTKQLKVVQLQTYATADTQQHHGAWWRKATFNIHNPDLQYVQL